LCFNIFEPVFVQVQIASALPQYHRKDMSSEPSIMASELTSINDLPEGILLKIFSHFGPEDLCLTIAKVCKKWNVLAKDKEIWKTLSYRCEFFMDINHITEVRCTALLGCSTN
jgi:hypothetical protein